MDEVLEVVTTEYIAELLLKGNANTEALNEYAELISEDTESIYLELKEINESVNKIESYVATGFFLVCIVLTATVIIKTFFTGW